MEIYDGWRIGAINAIKMSQGGEGEDLMAEKCKYLRWRG